ncbi:hypothetical protein PILCRDRAFT_638064 [Piloderma croceum F 1598]|uniref:Uncharacterized protein n=1 Tax=Piloderma croceum (strain F 1598) TaxID=765440 RepID=A0A0C3BHI7_PILCF|nr:hypothetical protein PILCRDRAFT_638064 [Piloderma croceum F 1598]
MLVGPVDNATCDFCLMLTRPVPSQYPWDDWNLDSKFFAALSRWTIDHPESTLERVLAKITAGIDNGNALIELISDSPFPARGLVTALVYLLKFGSTISNATRDVHVFAIEVVYWVGEVKSIFEHSKGGRFTTKTRRNLSEMRCIGAEF